MAEDVHVSTRLPPCFEQCSEGVCQFDEDGTAGIWICGAPDDPGVPVISNNDCFVGICAVDDADYIPDWSNSLFHDVS